jgi:hypothetical protein
MVSPQDLSCFSIVSTPHIGLATTEFKPGDQIWQFKYMDLAFVVRDLHKLSQGLDSEIVGRALVFEAVFEPKSWTGESLESHKPKGRVSRSDTLIQNAKISISCPEIFYLAFWADSTTPVADPFR